MALRLEDAQTLALGPFNPHIITPQWLLKCEVCADELVGVRFMPMSQGTAFNFKRVTWQVDSQSLLVSSRDVNCGDLVANVMKLLHHTPIRAVGNNFHYACGKEEWGHGFVPMLGTIGREDMASYGTVDQTRWAVVFFREDAVRIEATVALSDLGVAVLFNFHRETKDSQSAQVAAKSFDADKQASREMLQNLFKQRVES